MKKDWLVYYIQNRKGKKNMFNLKGIGAEDYGPPPPTVTQKITQAVQDVDKSVESYTGLKNFAMYAGVGLIGYVAYRSYNGE